MLKRYFHLIMLPVLRRPHVMPILFMHGCGLLHMHVAALKTVRRSRNGQLAARHCPDFLLHLRRCVRAHECLLSEKLHAALASQLRTTDLPSGE